VGKDSKVLLQDGRVVVQEKIVEKPGDEGLDAGKCQSLVVETQGHKGGAHRVKTLPVNMLRIRCDPPLQNSSQFFVSLARGQVGVVLVATRDVHVNLN